MQQRRVFFCDFVQLSAHQLNSVQLSALSVHNSVHNRISKLVIFVHISFSLNWIFLEWKRHSKQTHQLHCKRLLPFQPQNPCSLWAFQMSCLLFVTTNPSMALWWKETTTRSFCGMLWEFVAFVPLTHSFFHFVVCHVLSSTVHRLFLNYGKSHAFEKCFCGNTGFNW